MADDSPEPKPKRPRPSKASDYKGKKPPQPVAEDGIKRTRSSNDPEFPAKLKYLRKKNDYRAPDVIRLIERVVGPGVMSLTEYKRIEAGQRCRASQYAALAQAYNIDPLWLLSKDSLAADGSSPDPVSDLYFQNLRMIAEIGPEETHRRLLRIGEVSGRATSPTITPGQSNGSKGKASGG